MMRVALDSNILAYLAGVSRVPADDAKVVAVRSLIAKLASAATLLAPAQCLGELFVVLRKGGASAEEARGILLEFSRAFATSATETRTVASAADLVVDHQFQFWDALIVTAAADAGCVLLLSEDMQSGFVSRGLTILNPLQVPLPPKLAAILAPAE